MVQNFNLFLLCGGHHICDSSWNKTTTELDQCFKLYFPVKGEGAVVIDGERKTIEAGNVYLISGFRIEKQFCDNEMEKYWIHFMPDSLGLRYVLNNLPPFYHWKKEFTYFNLKHLEVFPQLFPNQKVLKNRIGLELYPHLACKAQSIILFFLSDFLQKNQIEAKLETNGVFRRMAASIEFMDKNLKRFPSLKEIAMAASLTPNYYHQLFTDTFKVTPLNYMNQRRVNIAKQLLTTTPQSIKEVAGTMGFRNELYFSRMFKKFLKISPSQFRAIHLSTHQR